MMARLVCQRGDPAFDSSLEALAAHLSLPVVNSVPGQPEADFLVTYREGRLSLVRNIPHPPSPTCVDFLDPRLVHRLRTSSRTRGLGRAAGLRRLRAPEVLDATAGLGRDALVLAWLGCRVILLERSPLVHALLEDGLRRARSQAQGPLLDAVRRLQLYHGEAEQWLGRGKGGTPDIIYLDPMFPPRNKAARVKKDIEALQLILGEAKEEGGELLSLARGAARRRVVVKRPARSGHAGGPADPAPDLTVRGGSCHYKVYLV